MRKIMIAAASLAAAVASPVFAAEPAETEQTVEQNSATVEVSKNDRIYGADGRRIGKVFRLSPEGDPQVIIRTRLYTIPASTLSEADGKISTTLTSKDITG